MPGGETGRAPFVRMESDDGENPLQFGFENIVFEIDNRCDDQKKAQPRRFCSLARFMEGSDIERKSVKRPNGRRASGPSGSGGAAAGAKDVAIAGAQDGDSVADDTMDMSSVGTVPRSGRHISFDDSCKKDDGDEVSNVGWMNRSSSHLNM